MRTWLLTILLWLLMSFQGLGTEIQIEAQGKGRIVYIQKQDVYIDLGLRDNVQTGDQFELYRELDKELIHPESKERLGYLYKKIGRIIVKWVREEFSIAEIVACEPGEEPKIMDLLVPYPPTESWLAKPRYGGRLKAGFVNEPFSLDPTKVSSATEVLITTCIYDTLFKLGQDGQPLPSLVKRWESKQGGLSYLLYLEDGVRFHNGTLLKPEDVQYSLTRLIGSGWDFGIKKVSVINKGILRIDLSLPDPNFLTKLSHPATSILPRDLLLNPEGGFFKRPVGTGPFKLEAFTSEEIILSANPDYFRGRPYIDGVTFSRFEDEGEALLEFEAGGLDYISIPQEEVRRLSKDAKWKGYISRDEKKTTHLLILNKKRLTSNQCEAIKYAIDRAAILNVLLNREGQMEDEFVYDPKRAKGLLGPSRPIVRLRFIHPKGSKTCARIAGKIRDDLSQVGISLDMQGMSWPDVIKRIWSGEYDLAYLVVPKICLDLYKGQGLLVQLISAETYTIHQPHLHHLKPNPIDRGLERVFLSK